MPPFLLHPFDLTGPERSTILYERGTLTVKLYAPRGADPQQPHERDEV